MEWDLISVGPVRLFLLYMSTCFACRVLSRHCQTPVQMQWHGKVIKCQRAAACARPSLHPVHQRGRRRQSPMRPRWRRSRGWSPRCAQGTCRARSRTLLRTPREQTPAAWQPWTRGERAQLRLWPGWGCTARAPTLVAAGLLWRLGAVAARRPDELQGGGCRTCRKHRMPAGLQLWTQP